MPTTTTPTTPPPPAPKPRNAATLKKALLELKDLPAGFSVESNTPAEDDTSFSAKGSGCTKLIAFLKADSPPGSKASAYRAYDGGQGGPSIEEQLDAMGSVKAVEALQKAYRSAVASCKTLTIKVPGQGSSPFRVTEVAAPEAGAGPFAVRFAASSGALEGLELTHVVTGVNDVVLSMFFAVAASDDIAGATESAVDKAKAVLGGGGSGT